MSSSFGSRPAQGETADDAGLSGPLTPSAASATLAGSVKDEGKDAGVIQPSRPWPDAPAEPQIPDLPGNVYAALCLAATAAQSGVFAKQHIAAGHDDDAAREARWAYHDAIRAYGCASGRRAVDVLAPGTCSCEAARKKDAARP